MGEANPEIMFSLHRHTKKEKDPTKFAEGYPNISSEGEEIVRAKTADLLKIIEESERGSVIIYAGASDLLRTKSTSRVSFDEVKKGLANNAEYMVMDESDINNVVSEQQDSARRILPKIVEANPNKKIILSYPLALKEFSLLQPEKGPNAQKPDWKVGGNKELFTEYLTELMKLADNDENKALRLWIENQGVITMPDGRVVKGPNPTEVAKEYVLALERLKKIATALFPDRPLVIQISSHSWDIDAFIAYATHEGQVTVETLDEIAKGTGGKATMISEFESAVLKISERNTLKYRGKEYPLNSSEFKHV